jgi:hypothetical protein
MTKWLRRRTREPENQKLKVPVDHDTVCKIIEL